MRQLIHKQDENMDMHVTICHELNSKSNNTNMHAGSMLYFNIWSYFMTQSTKFDINHASTSSIHKQEGKYTTLGLELEA